MTIQQLVLLDEEEQAEIICSAIFIDSRNDASCHIFLYQLYSFYIEIYFFKEVFNIKKIRGFSNTYPLLPYLNDIDITMPAMEKTE